MAGSLGPPWTNSGADRRAPGRPWRACRSRASGHSRARKLADGGREWRAEHGDTVASLTGAQAAVWQPGDGDEAVVEKNLSGGSAQASGEGVDAVRTGRGSPPFIWAGGRWGRQWPGGNGRLEGD
jgi:hypothetical protein